MNSPDPTPTSKAREDLIALERFAVSLLAQQNLDDLLWSMAQALGEIAGLDDCVIYLVENDHLVQHAAYGVKNPEAREILAPIAIPVGKGITGAVAASGRPELVRDTATDARYIADQFVGRSELAVPIVYQGRVLGVIDTEHAAPDHYGEEHLVRLVRCANAAAPRIASAIEEQQRRLAERALQEANERLEARVAMRTEELRAAVFRLELEAQERERLQQEALRSQKLESLGVLAGGLAHDFNNLLQGVVAHLEQIRHADAAADVGRVAECADAALGAVLRARDITTQLQTFARGGAPVRRVHDLAAILRETVQFCLRGTGVTATFAIAPGLRPVTIDAGQISQVVQNVTLNAVEAMAGNGRLWVTAAETRDVPNGGVTIALRDEGPGFRSEHLAKVFDPYFTTKTGGSGLGLAIAYGIVGAHGGSMSVANAPVGGAVVTIVLPVGGSAAPAVPQVQAAECPSLHVLLMDDDAMVRLSTRKLLERIGMTVTEAADGVAAIDRFVAMRGTRPVDVALLDLTVPGGMGGTEALRRLHELDPTLPGVVCSGYSALPVMAEPGRYGFAAVLPKPFLLADLRRVLAEVAARRRV